MKKLSVLLLAVLVTAYGFSQPKVAWSYVATKVKEKTYELRIIATIPSGWFIYSQKQPEESVSAPVSITITKSPLLKIPDTPFQEDGKLIRKRYPTLGYTANTYQDTVAFIKEITLKADVKTNVEGIVHFQACNDQICLPPEEFKFSISLQK